jgi:hypothetical protein
MLIKIDVEGAEFGVIKGAMATLSRSPRPTWLIEICFDEFHPAGVNPDFGAIFDAFFAHGYNSFAATDPLRSVSRDDVFKWVARGRADSGNFNYLFRPAKW